MVVPRRTTEYQLLHCIGCMSADSTVLGGKQLKGDASDSKVQ
jgi:hypothetical protein